MTQTMSSVLIRIHAHKTNVMLDDEGNTLVGNTVLADRMRLCKTPKDWSCRNATQIKPMLQGRDSTDFLVVDIGNGNHLALVKLVCLRLTQGNQKA